MTKRKLFLITILIFISFLLSATFANAQIHGNITTIDIYGSNYVVGNTGGKNVFLLFLTDSAIPQTGEIDDVYDNHVVIESTGRVTRDVYGGVTYGFGNVSNNTITIQNGGSARTAYGSYTYGNGNLTGNTVTIANGGEINGSVYGGYTQGDGNVTGNTLKISGTAVDVFSGFARGNGSVTGNIVELSGTARNVFGGYAQGVGNVTENVVTIKSGGTPTGYVYGGYTSGTGTITKNTVIIENGGIANFNVYGGYAAGTGSVTGNTITVKSGGSAGTAYGGRINNASSTATISNNTVIIESGGTVSTVYGGYTSGNGNVTDNNVIISGTVNVSAYGGYADGTGNVNNNTVTIESTANLAGASLFGYNITASGSGNTLKVNMFSGDVQEVNYFDTYNFVLGALTNLTVINITGVTPANIDNADINISFGPAFAGTVLNAGDEITVISSITGNADPNTVTLIPSLFVNYDFTETHDTGALRLIFNSISPQPKTEAVEEAVAAGLAFLGQAADLRSNLDISRATPLFTPFATMIYGGHHINSGSSVRVRGFSALAGMAFNATLEDGSQLAVGFFFEGGKGDYNSRNSFSNSATIKGSGNTEYHGGGVMARYATAGELYVEGSFVFGETETDFRSRDFVPGTVAKYDLTVPYYSAHVGVGKILKLNDMLGLDVYSKYLWTQHGGDMVEVMGYPFHLKDVNSHRLQVGAKLNADVSLHFKPYVRAAFEYEFDGKISGTLYGMQLKEPSLQGGMGIGELGLVWTPGEETGLKVDLGVQGFVGKREGVSGSLSISLSF